MNLTQRDNCFDDRFAGKDFGRTWSAPVAPTIDAEAIESTSTVQHGGMDGRQPTTSSAMPAMQRSDSITLLSSAVRGIGKGAEPTAIEVGNLSGVCVILEVRFGR